MWRRLWHCGKAVKGLNGELPRPARESNCYEMNWVWLNLVEP